MKSPQLLPRLAAGLFTFTAAGALPVALGVLSLAPSPARAQGGAPAEDAPAGAEGEISFDTFYQNLAESGDWYETPDFGYVFQPYIAYKNEAWRPYTDGYWAQTDQGWTWVSYEDFGWACYHYGRWTQLENIGWVWVPGYEWGPGWVSWRTSEDYIGWAPLPPKSTRAGGDGGASVAVRVDRERGIRPEDVEEDYDTGYNAGVDVQYDIGPAHYSFVPVQSFGAPYVLEAVVPVAQNIVIIENTTNVTNIVYRRGGRDDRQRVIYCGGPDYNLLSRRVERPIPRLLLERRPAVAVDRSRPRPREDRFSTVRENRLEVFAPFVSRPGGSGFRPPGPPPRIKDRLERPQVIRGWRGVQQQDPRLVERLRERFQQQARQAPPARQVAENFVTPAAFRAQPPPPILEQQRQFQPPTARGGGNNRAAVETNLPPPPPPPFPAAASGAPAGVPVQPETGFRPPRGVPGNPNQVTRPLPGNDRRGNNLSEEERAARRDARQREFEQRQGNRPAAGPGLPGNVLPPAPPNVVPGNPPGNPVVVPAAPPSVPAQPGRGNRSAEERDAYRAAKQAERARQNQPPAAPANVPPPPTEPNVERAPETGRRGGGARQLPPAAPPQLAQPPPAAPDNSGALREQRRAARQQQEEQQQQAQRAERAAQQQQQQQAAERSRNERSQQLQQLQQQQQQQAAERARAAQEQQQQQQRRAERPPQVIPQQPPAGPPIRGVEAGNRAREIQQQQQQQQIQAQRQAAEAQRRAAAPAEARPQPQAPPQAPPGAPGQAVPLTEEELRRRQRGGEARPR